MSSVSPENSSAQKFCGECGARLSLTCTGCGAANSPGQKFAANAELDLVSNRAPPEAGGPGVLHPKHLAERILTSKASLEGERKQVTVLFADLKGSMALLADRDPEEARKLLDPVLQLMMDAVHRYEGTVNQVMGDGIMALFGAPLAHEDHAHPERDAGLAAKRLLRTRGGGRDLGSSRSVASRSSPVCGRAPRPRGGSYRRGAARQAIRRKTGKVSSLVACSKAISTGRPTLMASGATSRSWAIMRTPSTRSTVASTYGSSVLNPEWNG